MDGRRRRRGVHAPAAGWQARAVSPRVDQSARVPRAHRPTVTTGPGSRVDPTTPSATMHSMDGDYDGRAAGG